MKIYKLENKFQVLLQRIFSVFYYLANSTKSFKLRGSNIFFTNLMEKFIARYMGIFNNDY